MLKIFNQVLKIGKSKTARDTYILFAGNLLDAIMAFLFTVLVFRVISTADFGIYSALMNMVIIIYSFLDLGIGASLIRFIPEYLSKSDIFSAHEYYRAGIQLRIFISFIAGLLIIISSPLIGPALFNIDAVPVVFAGFTIVGLSILDVFAYAFQAQQKFLLAAVTSLLYSISRVLFVLVLIFSHASVGITGLTILTTVAPWLGVILIWKFVDFKIIPLASKKIAKSLIKFSRWVGIIRIFSSIGARIDVQMILILAGPYQAGIYSVAARLASFYAIIVSSYTGVIAPRLSENKDSQQIRSLILKSLLVVSGLSMAMILGIIIAPPFITLLFGQKAIPAIIPFRLLTVANIPFVIGSLATSILIYFLKKPYYVSLVSIFQLFGIVIGNWLLIPKLGINGAAISIGIINFVVMAVSWLIVIWQWQQKSK
jgi:O-antigen/teichoic acid export membrane protein